ncbi:MAG: hypothetical protein VXZ39_09820, partial [Planctomycetota bacterium]|nr:hypothetical protein [Planctomycetota bacterium]
HHTELLEICDRLVELGPEGGEAGGELIAEGAPAELALTEASVTGPWLFGGRSAAAPGGGTKRKAANPSKARKPRAATRKKSGTTRRTNS